MCKIKIKTNQELFNQWKQLSYRVDGLKNIVCNNMEIDKSAFEEWQEKAYEIENDITELISITEDYIHNECEWSEEEKEYEFKGWDWSELGAKWGLVNIDEFGNYDRLDDELEKMIKEYIVENYDSNKNVVKDMKNYLKAMIECDDIYSPLWKGLLEIEDEFSFVQAYCTLLRDMWT